MENNVSILKGKTLLSVINNGNEELIFDCNDGSQYKLFHQQNCCDSVTIDDICGDLDDLIGSPLTMADEQEKDNEIKIIGNTKRKVNNGKC